MMLNTKIGDYTIVEELGRGGMSVVYRAADSRFDRDVAIKVLPAIVQLDPTFRQRFEREARTIARLEHSAIVPVYDYGEHEEQPYLVMRLMSGGSLADRIEDGPLSLDGACRIIDRIGSALDAAHNFGLIHRDVKPGNILFDNYEDAYLSDFGIVRLTEATAQLTGSGIVGTPAYMAPELAWKGGLTHLVDIYALGVTLFEMLAGQRPFEADTPMGLIMAHVSRPIPDICIMRPDLPENVQLIIDLAMAKDPEERCQSAGELAENLRRVHDGEDVEVPITSPEMEADQPLETQYIVDRTAPEVVDEPPLPRAEPAPPPEPAYEPQTDPFAELDLQPPWQEVEPTPIPPEPVHEAQPDSLPAPIFRPPPVSQGHEKPREQVPSQPVRAQPKTQARRPVIARLGVGGIVAAAVAGLIGLVVLIVSLVSTPPPALRPTATVAEETEESDIAVPEPTERPTEAPTKLPTSTDAPTQDSAPTMTSTATNTTVPTSTFAPQITNEPASLPWSEYPPCGTNPQATLLPQGPNGETGILISWTVPPGSPVLVLGVYAYHKSIGSAPLILSEHIETAGAGQYTIDYWAINNGQDPYPSGTEISISIYRYSRCRDDITIIR